MDDKSVKTACIVLPTYNEAGNIKRILDRIYSHVHKQTAVRVLTLVVDDSSPDGTAKLARAYSKRNKDVHVFERPGKEGLGAAYIAGMQYALRELKPDVILEMDADGSHDPAVILKLIAEIENGADFAIGSRYVPGGSIPKHWGFYRRLNSSVANGLVRTVLSLGKVKDCTGGFRAIRATYLEQLDWSKLHSKGYSFQISLLSAMNQMGAIITEVPIHFADREIGQSKMRLKDQLEFVLVTFRLRATHKQHAVVRSVVHPVAERRVSKKGSSQKSR
jgi:dolichol-phosphate mannosyltransferase